MSRSKRRRRHRRTPPRGRRRVAVGDEGQLAVPPGETLELDTTPSVPFEFAEAELEDGVQSGTQETARTDAGGPAQEAVLRPEPEGDSIPPTPSSEELLYRAARQAAAEGQTARARGIYRELLHHYPRNIHARSHLAILLDRAGQHDEALEELSECITLDPDNTETLVSRGSMLGSLGRYAEAEDDLHRALRLDASNAEAHFHLGVVIAKKGLWREAVPFLRRTLELDSSRAVAYFYLGEALNHVDDLDGALHCFQRAVELRPNDSRALYGLGIVLDRLNRPDEAAQMYRRSRELAGQ